MEEPGSNSSAAPIRFETDIKPMFREFDRLEMLWTMDLWSYDDVASNADEILDRLRDGSMPCDDPLPDETVDRFEQWIQNGMPE